MFLSCCVVRKCATASGSPSRGGSARCSRRSAAARLPRYTPHDPSTEHRHRSPADDGRTPPPPCSSGAGWVSFFFFFFFLVCLDVGYSAPTNAPAASGVVSKERKNASNGSARNARLVFVVTCPARPIFDSNVPTTKEDDALVGIPGPSRARRGQVRARMHAPRLLENKREGRYKRKRTNKTTNQRIDTEDLTGSVSTAGRRNGNRSWHSR